MERIRIDGSGNDYSLSKINPVICSALVFITTFIISQLLFQVVTGLAAILLNYSVKIGYNLVHVEPNRSRYWSLLRVSFVYLPAPFFSAAGGFVILNYLKFEWQKTNLLRLYAFWFMVCFINLFLSHLIFSPVGIYSNGVPQFYASFAVVASWMGLNTGFMGLFAGMSIIVSLLFGYFIKDEVLKWSYSDKLLGSNRGQRSLIFRLFILPVILSAGPLLYLCTEKSIYQVIIELFNLSVIFVGMELHGFSTRAMVSGTRGAMEQEENIPYAAIGLAMAAWLGTYALMR